MGHIFRTPRELAELEEHNTPHIAQIIVSRSLGVHQTIGHCSVDLKLGNSGDSEIKLLERLKDSRHSLMESASSGPSKRARVPGSGTQVPSCLVDGCTADLSKCRDYHRRHKVCELHSKTSKVFIKGQEQRFCQQCSRFHSLVEFDEGKRSCRKRLDGHNRRRRKPQPDSVSLNSSRLFSNQQGTRYLQFGGSQLFSTSTTSSAWAGTVKAEDDPTLYNCQSSMDFNSRKNFLPASLSQSYKTGKQLPFLTIPADSVSQTNLDINSGIGNSGSSQQKLFSDGLNRVVESNSALSLLSSQSAGTREIGMNQIVQPDLNPPHYNSLGMENEAVGSVLVSDGSNHTNNLHNHNHNMFQMGPDGSSASGSHQTLSFSWE